MIKEITSKWFVQGFFCHADRQRSGADQDQFMRKLNIDLLSISFPNLHIVLRDRCQGAPGIQSLPPSFLRKAADGISCKKQVYLIVLGMAASARRVSFSP